MAKLLVLSLLVFHVSTQVLGQKKVSITIDDVPNTELYQKENYQSSLLNLLDSLNIPATIFINEGLIYKTDSIVKNFELLDNWIKSKNITIGNHTFSHPKYSEVGLTHFTNDVKKGEAITKELAKKHNKQLKYFRFPFNDLGKDSIQHSAANKMLQQIGYVITPFTVESSDWMFNRVYMAFWEEGNYKRAREVGELYVSKTLDYFHYFDSLSSSQYSRQISQIYLCHDNKLNIDYLPSIISKLQGEGYEIVSIEEALKDDFYNQKDEYYYRWGVSWFYRYMKSHRERIKLMQVAPTINQVEDLYNNLGNN